MTVRDWTTTSAKYGAAFLLGAASLGVMVLSLNRRPPATVRFAPSSAQAETPPVATPRPADTPSATPLAQLDPLAERPAEPMATPPEPVEPQAAPATEPPRPVPAALDGTHKINLNTATQAELELLPGIGPAMAKRILEHRQTKGRFTSVEQLDDVKGIGPKTLAKLRPLVTVE